MIKKLKVVDFLEAIPYYPDCVVTSSDDDKCHCFGYCVVTSSDDDKCHYFAYVKLDCGLLLRTYDFKSFWSIMQELDEVAEMKRIRLIVKTPLFRESMVDDFTSFDLGF